MNNRTTLRSSTKKKLTGRVWLVVFIVATGCAVLGALSENPIDRWLIYAVGAIFCIAYGAWLGLSTTDDDATQSGQPDQKSDDHIER